MAEDRRIIRTVSPRAGYGADVLRAHVEDGRLVKVEADTGDRVARGKLTSFAKRYVERNYNKERLLQPMVRTGEAGGDDFEPISWDAAIELAADALDRISRKQDPRALLYYTGHGHDGASGCPARIPKGRAGRRG